MSNAAQLPKAGTPVLEMRNISKTFGSTRALSNVSLTVHPGEVHALMGENGAGKSTLMKVLSGAYTADAGGSILIDGNHIVTGDPIKAKANGISVIYQELSLAPNLTVAQNMFLCAEPSRYGVLDKATTRERAEPILRRLGIEFGPSQLVASLSLGERQMVEIARAPDHQRTHHRHGRADHFSDLAGNRIAFSR